MASFHLTPEGPKRCTATTRPCPVGGEHFEDPKVAEAAFAEKMTEEHGALPTAATKEPDYRKSYSYPVLTPKQAKQVLERSQFREDGLARWAEQVNSYQIMELTAKLKYIETTPAKDRESYIEGYAAAATAHIKSPEGEASMHALAKQEAAERWSELSAGYAVKRTLLHSKLKKELKVQQETDRSTLFQAYGVDPDLAEDIKVFLPEMLNQERAALKQASRDKEMARVMDLKSSADTILRRTGKHFNENSEVDQALAAKLEEVGFPKQVLWARPGYTQQVKVRKLLVERLRQFEKGGWGPEKAAAKEQWADKLPAESLTRFGDCKAVHFDQLLKSEQEWLKEEERAGRAQRFNTVKGTPMPAGYLDSRGRGVVRFKDASGTEREVRLEHLTM